MKTQPNSKNMQDRLKKQNDVKAKIQAIMQSVKQQKQHIQNKLATNDHKIQLYCQEYQALKQINDFTHLTKNESILLNQLAQSLQQTQIDPQKIIGGKQMGVNCWVNFNSSQTHYKNLNNEQIITIQTMLIDKLAAKVKEKKENKTPQTGQVN